MTTATAQPRTNSIPESWTDPASKPDRVYFVNQRKYNLDRQWLVNGCLKNRPRWHFFVFWYGFLPIARWFFFHLKFGIPSGQDGKRELYFVEHQGWSYNEWEAYQEAERHPFANVIEMRRGFLSGQSMIAPQSFPNSTARERYEKAGRVSMPDSQAAKLQQSLLRADRTLDQAKRARSKSL